VTATAGNRTADAAPTAAAVAEPAPARSLLGWRTIAGLFAAALVVRVVYCLVVLRDYTPISDASDYYKIAVSFSEGRGISTTFPYGYEHPTAFRPPLFPALLGVVFAVTGPSLGVAQAVQVLLGSTVVVLLAVLAARFGGRRAGLIAGGLAAIYPPLLANDGPPLTEPLALTLLLAGLLALGQRKALIAGLLIGALVLTRPSAQLLVPVIGLWFLIQVGWRRTVVFAVAVGIVVLPWVARNQIEFGKPVLVTSNGFNMNAAWSEVSLAQAKPSDGVYDPRFAHLRTGAAAYNEAELDANLRENGLEGLKNHKSEVPGVVWRNARFLLDLHRGYENGAERYDGRNLTLRYWAVPATWVVMAAGVIGLIRLRRRRLPESGLILLCGAYFLLISIAAVSPPRLRAPLDVLFLLGTATLIAAGWARWSARRGTPPAGAVDQERAPTVVDLSDGQVRVRP
jgi:4-amino-4-deoxy-L-arabinose transferase-like glycosyltransferase